MIRDIVFELATERVQQVVKRIKRLNLAVCRLSDGAAGWSLSNNPNWNYYHDSVFVVVGDANAKIVCNVCLDDATATPAFLVLVFDYFKPNSVCEFLDTINRMSRRDLITYKVDVLTGKVPGGEFVSRSDIY